MNLGLAKAIPSAALVALAFLAPAARAAEPSRPAETFDYRVNWRFWHAGDVRLRYQPRPLDAAHAFQAELELISRGFVDALYRVRDAYWVLFDGAWCASSSMFQVQEGRKLRRITVAYQQPPGKAVRQERNLANDEILETREVDVPACVHDELAALARLRAAAPEPGQTLVFPVSNGKKTVEARVEVQEREVVTTPAGEFQAIRCEAFLFNNVLYRRDGRLFVWLTDDARRLPVKIELRLPFYIGTVTLALAGEEK